MGKLSHEIIEKELLQHHNHSWYTELYNRNKNSLDDIALIYRGTKIKYRELFDNILKYAKALKKWVLDWIAKFQFAFLILQKLYTLWAQPV